MVNMLRAVMEKVSNMQEYMGDVSRDDISKKDQKEILEIKKTLQK